MDSKEIKAIETEYKGCKFRSRLEARWAVFFDACGVEWEYEPEGYDLGDGLWYLPDFLLHGVEGRDGGDLYVEVKGKMTAADVQKIDRFVSLGMGENHMSGKSKTAILVVGAIPGGNTMNEIINSISDAADGLYFNFGTIDGDDFYTAYPGINRDGGFELFGGDYLGGMNPDATEAAFRKARQTRFERKECPTVSAELINPANAIKNKIECEIAKEKESIVPSKRNRRVQLLLTNEEYELAKSAADNLHISFNNYIARIIKACNNSSN